MTSLPELKLTVFTDYICPFCYVGHHRLMRLRDSYDLKINWCFLEIHPETSAAGEPVAGLEYSSDHWNKLVGNLHRVAAEEDIPVAELGFITNSQDALVLAEAAKTLGRDAFYQLHETLFRAYFVEQRNIGDREVLRDITRSCGIDEGFTDEAWNNASLRHRLVQNFSTARQFGIQSVPSFVFGERVLTGVVGEEVMRDAAAGLLAGAAETDIPDE